MMAALAQEAAEDHWQARGRVQHCAWTGGQAWGLATRNPHTLERWHGARHNAPNSATLD